MSAATEVQKCHPKSGHPLKGSCKNTVFSLGPKPQGVCLSILPAGEARESAPGRRRGMNSKEQGNGVGQPARAKERPGTRCWERQRGGEGRRDEKLANSLAKVNPSSWRLLIRIHSSNTGQISEPAARGRGPPCSQGEVSSGPRREGLLPRRGVT